MLMDIPVHIQYLCKLTKVLATACYVPVVSAQLLWAPSLKQMCTSNGHGLTKTLPLSANALLFSILVMLKGPHKVQRVLHHFLMTLSLCAASWMQCCRLIFKTQQIVKRGKARCSIQSSINSIYCLGPSKIHCVAAIQAH